MAQLVGYNDNNDVISYCEGPFVVVNTNGYRIEQYLENYHCPVLPDMQTYKRMNRLGLDGKHWDLEKVSRVCDILNQEWKEDHK